MSLATDIDAELVSDATGIVVKAFAKILPREAMNHEEVMEAMKSAALEIVESHKLALKHLAPIIAHNVPPRLPHVEHERGDC